MLHRTLTLILLGLSFLCMVLAASRTSPPSGALVVRAGTTKRGEYRTISSAVKALPNDSSSRFIFIHPGTYNEQVSITRAGPLTIYGYTTDTSTYGSNKVTLQASLPAIAPRSNDDSGTLRIHKDNFKIYNVNVRNNHGPGAPAIAVSQYGNRVGFYACGIYGYQDTLLANEGAQVYLKSYIEGAVDFIFGLSGLAYFGGNTIAVKGPGFITASGRATNDASSYVFKSNKIVLAPGAVSGTAGGVFLGRPWGAYAKVIFRDTVATVALNNTIWSVWGPSAPHTSHVFLRDYDSTGVGFNGARRPNFANSFASSQAASYSISSAVGRNYASWVDTSYLV